MTETSTASSATPEADRLFAPPTPEEAAHALRDLTWGEHFVATRASSTRGPTQSYLYGLVDAAVFFADEHPLLASIGSKGSYTLIDVGKFIAWIRDVVQDVPLADVLETQLSGKEAVNDITETLARIFMLRVSQYEPYLHDEKEQHA